MKRYEVRLTEHAERDLESIHAHLTQAGSRINADRLLDRLLRATDTLETAPERGAHPRELIALGIRDYRQIVVGPHRIFYCVEGEQVIVHLIADGRQDMQLLLQRRLLGA